MLRDSRGSSLGDTPDTNVQLRQVKQSYPGPSQVQIGVRKSKNSDELHKNLRNVGSGAQTNNSAS